MAKQSKSKDMVAETPDVTVSRRGRPTLSQAAEIDRNLLAIARSLFLTHGYAVTSMEAVATKAGVSKTTLYARYASKADMFRAIATDRLRAWSLLAPGPRPSIGTIKDRLTGHARNILKGISMPEVRAFERLLSAEANRFPELYREFYDRGLGAATQSTLDELRQALGEQKATTLDVTAVAQIFTAGLIGWYRVESPLRKISARERNAFADQMAELCLKGLGFD